MISNEGVQHKVLVVGGGISGLTLAAALGQSGQNVDVVEIKPTLSDGGGVGLTLVANAMRALDAIGIAEACMEVGVPADNLGMLRPDGSVLGDNPLPRIGGPKWPGGTGISRAAFHAILVDAVRKAGVSPKCGTTLEDWEESPDGVSVRLSDGTAGDYDLVVCADGLYSKLRPRLIPGVEPEFTGQVVWRVPLERPSELVTSELYLGGPAGLVGLCPISRDLAYGYVVEAAPDNPRRDRATLHDQMKEKLAGYGGRIGALAPTITDPKLVSYSALDWIMAPPPWGTSRIRMIGDAAHANPPVLAQGAAMGIEDAIVLAEELAADTDMDSALDRFVRRREPRVRMVVATSRQLARWEVEHTPGVDVAKVMREAAQELAKPI